MRLTDLLAVGFQQSAQCLPAWQDKGQVVCRHFGRALITILCYADSSQLEVLVGDVHTPQLYFRAPQLSLSQLQSLLRDYWPTV